MKIKDLPKGTNMGGVKIKIPKGHEKRIPFKEGYWKSQWGYKDGKAGVFVTKNIGDTRIYPICINSLSECLEWEIVK